MHATTKRTTVLPAPVRGGRFNRSESLNDLSTTLTAATALVLLVAVSAGCPADRRDRGDSARSAVPVDTTPMDLSRVQTSLPPTLPDTFKGQERRVARRSAGEVAEPPIPPAPPALMDAVTRERSFSRFCYQEFGQKVDPSLSGGVAVVVTVGPAGITGARVANDTWSSSAGSGVNRCLDDRARSTWKLAAGAVPAGKYVVRMTFTGK